MSILSGLSRYNVGFDFDDEGDDGDGLGLDMNDLNRAFDAVQQFAKVAAPVAQQINPQAANFLTALSPQAKMSPASAQHAISPQALMMLQMARNNPLAQAAVKYQMQQPGANQAALQTLMARLQAPTIAQAANDQVAMEEQKRAAEAAIKAAGKKAEENTMLKRTLKFWKTGMGLSILALGGLIVAGTAGYFVWKWGKSSGAAALIDKANTASKKIEESTAPAAPK